MIDAIDKVVNAISSWLYTPWVPAFLIVAGLYFTARTKFIQFRLFGESIHVVSEKPKDKNSVSSLGALMVSTASRVGTGNIVGVSSAICVGGYGAVFWMWITAILGGASAFIESTLAQIYKKRDGDGSSYGGPSYYMEDALHQRWLGVVFAVIIILTYAVGYNALASYNLQSAFAGFSFYKPGVTPYVLGGILAVLFAVCVLGGAKRLTNITGILVPVMGVIYIIVSLIVICINIGNIPSVFANIFRSAFDFKAIFGGFLGSAMMQGIKRGLYSNEAGMGSAPNAAATASVSHPVKQGLVQSLSVYIDTLLICTCSAMMVMVFWVQDPEAAMALNGMPLVQMAVNNAVGEVGIHFITFAIFAFAFSSLIGNYFYAETNFRYIFKNTKWGMLIFRVLCLAAIFYGCVNSFDLAWNLADIFMGFMAIINLVAILLLGKWALAALDDYTRQRKEGKDPVFIAASVPGMPACECWTTADLPNFGDNPVEEYIEEAASLDSEGLR